MVKRTRGCSGVFTGTSQPAPLTNTRGHHKLISAQEIRDFEGVLKNKGVRGALRFLNARTPHRFTGVYRYDGTILRNIVLFDQYDPDIHHGDDFAMIDAPCARVGEHGGTLVVEEFLSDPRFRRSFAPIVSYCGALIRGPGDIPFGTVCHFDTKPCETPPGNALLLEAVAPLIYSVLQRREGSASQFKGPA